jgi:hypothetical protein
MPASVFQPPPPQRGVPAEYLGKVSGSLLQPPIRGADSEARWSSPALVKARIFFDPAENFGLIHLLLSSTLSPSVAFHGRASSSKRTAPMSGVDSRPAPTNGSSSVVGQRSLTTDTSGRERMCALIIYLAPLRDVSGAPEYCTGKFLCRSDVPA